MASIDSPLAQSVGPVGLLASLDTPPEVDFEAMLIIVGAMFEHVVFLMCFKPSTYNRFLAPRRVQLSEPFVLFVTWCFRAPLSNFI